MFKNKSIISFIGARNQSKGLKDKNIIDFAGKPMIHWAIHASLQSKYIDRTIVSTDSKIIAAIAEEGGADVPFLRPDVLAGDKTLIEDAMKHAIIWLEKNEEKKYDFILLLQPTSPLRKTKHIDEAVEKFFADKKSDEDTLISVIKAPEKIGWLMSIDNNDYIHFYFKDARQRQELPKYFFPNGMIYLTATKRLKKTKLFDSNLIPYITEESISVDIDTQEEYNEALNIYYSMNK